MKKFFGFLLTTTLLISVCSCSRSENEAPENSLSDSLADDPVVATEAKTEPVSECENKDNTINNTKYSDLFSERDKSGAVTEITAEIILDGDSIKCESENIVSDGSHITIKKAGIYRVSGTLNDGQIAVDAPGEKVQLVLDNADITCKNSSAIYGIDSDKIFITLADESENSLTDGSSYDIANESSDEPDACIFSCDSLTLNGNGKLSINANYSDGIHSKDDIVITGGSIDITAVGDGIKGKDYTAVCGGIFNIESGQDGIKATEKNDVSLGFVYIEGGTFRINSQNDGIQSERELVIADGEFHITSGGGIKNSAKEHSDMNFGDHDLGGNKPHGGFGEDMTPPDGFGEHMTPPDGFGEGMTPPDGFGEGMTPPERSDSTPSDDTDNSQLESFKGLKAGTSLNIYGGSFTVDSADDALHSNENITISGGQLELTAGDDGIHGDIRVEISGGTVKITDSYEGIEGKYIEISGGTSEIRASDDGLNASDGTPQDGLGTYSEGTAINISDGLLYVDSDGDGLDSNGDMSINGGIVIVNGSENGGNGALDSNSEIVVSGGLLIAAGNSRMAECPGSSSSQYTVSADFESTLSGGTLVTLTDSSGNEILSFAPVRSFDNIVISSPDITENTEYTFFIGGTSSAGSQFGLFDIGGYNNDGSASLSFTVSQIISSVGQRQKSDFKHEGRK